MVETITDESPREEPLRPGSTKLSINVEVALGERLRRTAFELRVSESSIVEVALTSMFEGRNDADLAQFLREGGASLRRRKVTA
jgi:hypothetical protein